MHKVLLLLTIFLFSVNSLWGQPFLSDVNILSSDQSHVVVEIAVPAPAQSEYKDASGISLHLPGYTTTANPGEPALPFRSVPIGIPPGAQPGIDILEIKEITEDIEPVLPAPTYPAADPKSKNEASGQLIYKRAPDIYQSNSFYPSENVSLGAFGKMRGLHLWSVHFYPIRYNAVAGQIKRVTRIRFSIHFNNRSANSLLLQNSVQSSAFQTLFSNTVVNYATAQKWRNHKSLEKMPRYFLEAGNEWFKLTTEAPGLYRVTADELANVGFALQGLDPHYLKIFNMGQEIAVHVHTGDDTVFAHDDYIEFYAQAFKSEYTTKNVYWLTVGSETGMRMRAVDATPVHDYPLLSTGHRTLHHEIDYFRYGNFPGHTNQEHWFMDSLFTPGSVSYQVDLGKIDEEYGGKSTFTLRMQGYAAMQAIDPDHHTVVHINGVQVMDKWWDGRINFVESVSFDQSILQDGLNQVDIIGPGDTGSFLDWQFIDFFELEYFGENSTSKDSLAFSIETPGSYTIKIDDLSSPIDIYDISDANKAVYISGAVQEEKHVLYEYTVENEASFIVAADAKKNNPLLIERDEASVLRSTSNRADYIIIGFKDFLESVQPLANFHAGNGLLARVVDVQDIYDEFGYGIYDKNAIKAFLHFAYHNWAKPAPSFVLLVGDASRNPRMLRPESERYGSGNRTDFVPTHFFEADVDNVEAMSDTWFGCLDGPDDVLPEYLIGRLPGRSTIETQYMVQKTLDYMLKFEPGAWQNTAAFVADIGEGGTLAFEDFSDAYIQDYMPENFQARRIYLSELGMPATKEAILESFGNGCLTLNYFGHGSVYIWSAKSIFQRDDLPMLAENINLPFVFTMSCINGDFADPGVNGDGLGEQLVAESNRGALSVFTGSGKAYASVLQPLAQQLYHTLYTETKPQVGVFTHAGLLAMFGAYPERSDHTRFYILFGDPAARLHYTNAGASQRYAWFSGTVDMEGKTPPAQSELLAFIKDRQFSQAAINERDGSFGPLYIPKDDSLTTEKDGGSPGDSVCFKLSIGDSQLVHLQPCAIWQKGEHNNLQLSVKPTGVHDFYRVQFFVDQRQVGEDFFDGDPISAASTIYAEISVNDGTLERDQFELVINNNKIENSVDTRVIDFNPVSKKMTLAFSPQNLNDGQYDIQLRPRRAGATFDAKDTGFCFSIQSAIALERVVNFPNPFMDKTRFTYVIHNDRSADIQIKIYTVAGRLIQILHAGFSDVGYNEIEWDGRDAYGDVLANGVYFYKIIADDGDERVQVVERLVVMR